MKDYLTYIRRAAIPRFGRFSRSQLEFVGQNLNPPGVLAWGPFMVLVDLPQRFWKQDPETSLEDFNAAMKAIVEQLQAGLIDPGPVSN